MLNKLDELRLRVIATYMLETGSTVTHLTGLMVAIAWIAALKISSKSVRSTETDG